MGNCKRKQESKKTRKHAFNQESDQEKITKRKKTRFRPRKRSRKKEKKRKKTRSRPRQRRRKKRRKTFFLLFLLYCFLLQILTSAWSRITMSSWLILVTINGSNTSQFQTLVLNMAPIVITLLFLPKCFKIWRKKVIIFISNLIFSCTFFSFSAQSKCFKIWRKKVIKSVLTFFCFFLCSVSYCFWTREHLYHRVRKERGGNVVLFPG